MASKAGRKPRKSANPDGNEAEILVSERVNGTDDLERLSIVSYEGDFDITPVGPEDFQPQELLGYLRRMILARKLDEKMLTLLKQGRGFFHIGCSGHEVAQIGVGLHARPGFDWASPYYRDMAFCMTLGITTRQVLLAHLSKADDITSSGRQMPEHFSSPDLNIMLPASSVGAQYLPAVGAAMAVKWKGDDAFVYVSGGDGSTSQGAFHESLNWAAKDRLPVLFHIQDNRYAISVHRNEQTAGGSIYKIVQGYENLARCLVDGTDFFQTYAVAKAAVERLRSGAGPVCFVSEVVRLLPHSSSDSDVKYRTPEEMEADKTMDPILRMEDRLMEAGILTEALREETYASVKEEIDDAAAWAYEQPDPDPATVATNVFFEGSLDLDFESSVPDGSEIVMVDAINHALHEEMERDERVIVYGEDVAGGKGGVFTATRELTARFGRNRCFNSPLAEDAILGTAVGLSIGGYRPVVEIQFGDYIWPGMQQLRNVISSYRYRSDGRWACPMVIRVPIGGYIHGGPYHSQNIESIFGHTPGILIAIPSTASDAKGLLKTAIRSQDPILFLEHKWLYRQPVARSPEPHSEFLLPFGRARIVHEGSDLTIITYGATVYKSMDAVRQLEHDGASIELIDLRTIVPLDMETVLRSVRKTHRVLVVHEDHTFGGFGGEVAAQIANAAFEELDAPVRRVGGTFTPVPMADPLEKAALPGETDVLEAAKLLLEY